jgi:hypothetical protein
MELIRLSHLLPEKNKLVLLYHKQHGFLTGYMDSIGYEHYRWFDYLGYDFSFSEISHWAKLPEKPKEEYGTMRRAKHAQ